MININRPIIIIVHRAIEYFITNEQFWVNFSYIKNTRLFLQLRVREVHGESFPLYVSSFKKGIQKCRNSITQCRETQSNETIPWELLQILHFIHHQKTLLLFPHFTYSSANSPPILKSSATNCPRIAPIPNFSLTK